LFPKPLYLVRCDDLKENPKRLRGIGPVRE